MKHEWIPVVALALTIVGCNSPVAGKNETSTITTDVVKKQDLVGYSFFDGKIVIPPSAQADAFSPFDTPVISVTTSLGKYVSRGDLIVKLTIPGAEDAAAAAKANSSSAKATYSDERAGASGPVVEAKRALDDAKAAEKAAKDDVAAGGSADVAAATQERIGAETTLREAQQQMRETLQPSKQAVKQASFDLQTARADAQKGIVRAPISGTVVALPAKPGLMAKANENLATIINFSAVRVQGTVPSELKDLVIKKSRVIIAMNGQSSDPIDGVVLDVTVLPPSAGQKGPGYLAVIAFVNPRAVVQAQPSVKRIGVKTGLVKNALVVPVGAISKKDGKSIVSVKNGEAWVETPIEIGITDGALVEVKSGLSEGAVVRVTTPPAG